MGRSKSGAMDSLFPFDERLEGVRRLMDSDFTGPVNIGSEERVAIDQLCRNGHRYLATSRGPLGVWDRNSDNRLIREN